ncbi:sugar phosphate isomerase/epimerase [Paenibacillus sp. OV219]|uniref:sugar phosphate isomerase/epimerase family protein n=1 Tax=Paenibacillus sp. OV219 TaxID=1884377 RepID=UPI0008AE9F07|nr:TIM barrel protein [Paenibacillus sp. OV219]SEO88574.1 Sugar phosphate isomerase/epimerase [Paenibacillus sp. OV219]
MRLQIYKSLWGMEHLTYQESLRQIAAAGYEGVEAPVPQAEHVDEFMELLREHRLHYIALIASTGSSLKEHIETFANGMGRAALLNPQLIISHSARDCMSDEDQAAFFRAALSEEKAHGVAVGHETHRHRAMYTPWNTAKMLHQFPDLKLTADFSHWCCVCETLLHDQAEAIALASERTIHIHARVGYSQGPQVPHPAAPEYELELRTHEAWWRNILSIRQARGLDVTTATPEYGPPGYMHTLPFTRQPVSDPWDTCLWMKDRIGTSLTR